MAAEQVLSGQFTSEVRRLDEKIGTLGDRVSSLEERSSADNEAIRAELANLTRTINRWGGAIAVIVVIAMLILGRLIALVGF